MPNWCEGTLKIRGSVENICRFIENGFSASANYTEIEENGMYFYGSKSVDKSEWLDCEKDPFGDSYYILKAAFQKPFYTIYINDTNQAFVGDEHDVVIYPEDYGPVVIPFKQAWGIRENDWADLSKKYELDFRLYGVETLGQFCRDVEIVNGEVTVNKTIHYDDWYWECPVAGWEN